MGVINVVLESYDRQKIQITLVAFEMMNAAKMVSKSFFQLIGLRRRRTLVDNPGT